MNPKNVNIPTLSGKPSFTQNVTNAKPNEQPNINDDINRLISEDIFPFNYFHGQIYNHSTTLTSMGSISVMAGLVTTSPFSTKRAGRVYSSITSIGEKTDLYNQGSWGFCGNPPTKHFAESILSNSESTFPNIGWFLK